MTAVRSFIAVDVDEPDLVAEIVKIQEQIASSSARIKLVERQNLHFTLKFLGDVEESRLDVVKTTMEKVLKEFRPFSMYLRGLGAFPRINRPNVIWVGVEDGREVFVEIAKKLDNALSKHGFRREGRRFEPHLTIARVKGYSGDLPEVIRRIGDVEVGQLKVDEVRLKKSTLTPKGPIYDTLHAVRLKRQEVEETK